MIPILALGDNFKKQILLLVYILINTNLISQTIVDYKNDCDAAYSQYLSKDYKSAYFNFKKIDKKYDMKREDLLLYFQCAALLNKRLSAQRILNRTNSIYSIDHSFLSEEMALVHPRIKNGIKYREKFQKKIKENKLPNRKIYCQKADSIKNVIRMLENLDQDARMILNNANDEREKDFANLEMQKIDSLNALELIEIIKIYGFPGDKNIPFSQASSELLLFHFVPKTNFFYYDSLLLNELYNENLAPNAYAYWYDRNMILQNKSPKFHSSSAFPVPQEFIFENRKIIGMSKFYPLMVY